MSNPNDYHPDPEADFAPLMDDAPRVDRFIQQCARLLQRHALRTSDIVAILFHGEVHRMRDLAEIRRTIAYCMWDAGYTPVPADPTDPEWHWHEQIVTEKEDRDERK